MADLHQSHPDLLDLLLLVTARHKAELRNPAGWLRKFVNEALRTPDKVLNAMLTKYPDLGSQYSWRLRKFYDSPEQAEKKFASTP